MAETASVRSGIRLDAGSATALTGGLVGVILAIVGWWVVYAAWRTYGAEVTTLGLPDEPGLVLLRVIVGVVAFVLAFSALLWRAVATGLALAAGVGLVISAYLRFVVDGALFLVGVASSPPGKGLASANPLLGVANDLGYAVTEAIFAPPLLLLSAGWIAIALAWWLPALARRNPDGDFSHPRRLRRAAPVLLGGLVAALAIGVIFVAERATSLMFARGELSPLQPALLLTVGLVAGLVLLRLPAALLGAVAVSVAALVISALGLVVPASASSHAAIWSVALSDIPAALSSAAHSAGLLVLFGTWCAALASWAYARISPDR